MSAAALPFDEDARLAVLRSYRVVDTKPEAALDALTRQSREVCGVSMATLRLVDERRQWFKSRVGVSWTEAPRDHSFCAHALLSPSLPLVVPDATHDARFADNPAVTSEPHVRFYAGVPLLSVEGQPLGTLCVFDQEPRELSSEQIEQLGILAQQAAYHLALSRRTSTEHCLAQWFVLTLLLLVGIVGLCFWQARRFLASDQWVAHTKEVTAN